MLNKFLNEVLGKKTYEKMSIDDIVFVHNLKSLVPSNIIIISISLYWLIIDLISDNYNLDSFCKFAIFAQLIISVIILIAYLTKKKYDRPLVRATFLIYYFVIVFGVFALTYSRNLRLLAEGNISLDIGVSIWAFYLLVILFMPMPDIKDSIIISLMMALGIILPDILAMTSLYNMCCDLAIVVCFIVIYFYYRKILLESAKHELMIVELNDELSKSSYCDALTDILNRRSMDEYLKYLINNYAGNKMGIIIFDIDYFKKHNDYYGHSKSDFILHDLAKIAENCVMQYDDCFLFRYGGEEFIVIINKANEELIKQIALGIKNAVYEANFARDDIQEFDRVTISLGAAIEDIPNSTGDYISNADSQLYLGKEHNRNAAYFNDQMIGDEGSVKIADAEHGVNNNYLMSKVLLNICEPISDICAVCIKDGSLTIYRQDHINIRTDLMDKKHDYKQFVSSYIDKYVHPLDKQMMFEKMNLEYIISHLQKDEVFNIYYRVLENDEIVHYNIRCLPYKEGNDDAILMSFSPEVVDINKAQLSTILETDELTNVYTKRAFYQYASRYLDENPNYKYSIVISDIENFRLANKIYGTAMGDEVLKYFANTYSDIRQCKVIGRYASDEFIMLLRLDDDGDAVYKELLSCFANAPIPNLSIKYGVYHAFPLNEKIESACDKALLALKHIKHNNDEPICLYSDEIANDNYREHIFEANFESALLNNEFIVNCQPKYHTISKTLVGGEALIRWKNKDGIVIPPNEFIPIFEKNGTIHKLDEYVFAYVCNRQRQLIDKGIAPLPVSVNVSRNTLFNEAMLSSYLKIIEKTNIDKKLVPLEITESSNDVSRDIKDVLLKIKNAGFTIHMDDFGRGYSSLANMSTMPIDMIKIDKSLIDNIGNDNGDELLRHIIELSHFYDMPVVGEGVETFDQYNFLKNLECDYIQGFYFSKNIPFEDFEALVVDNQINEVKQVVNNVDNLGAFKITSDERMSYLLAMSSIYMTMHVIDLENNTVIEFATTTNIKEYVNRSDNARAQMIAAKKATVAPEYIDRVLEFVNLDTLPQRMKGLRSISMEFKGIHFGLCRAQFITISKNEFDEPTKVIYTTQVIEKAKEVKENTKVWYTDETTGVFNKLAYEEDLKKYADENNRDYFFDDDSKVLVLKINDLKNIIEFSGATAGDEALTGVAIALAKVFADYGKIYRLDENTFVVIYCRNNNNDDLDLLSTLKEYLNEWMGIHTRSLDVSYECANQKEEKVKTVGELVNCALNKINE